MIDLDKLYFGIVEDVMNDETESGMVRVRWIGLHTDDKVVLPTEMLPWASVMQPIYSAAISGVGMSPVGIVNGTMVAGIFQDEGKQQPIVLFTVGGNRNVFINAERGFNDPDGMYPLSGVTGDVNYRAGGSANTGYGAMKDTSTSVSADSGDPTVQAEPIDPKYFKDAPWMEIANGELGVSEEKNPDRVKLYHKTSNGQDMSATVAWCASFVGYCLDKVNIRGSRSAMARSYVNYGTKLSTDDIPFGAIIVLQGTRGPSSGHVVFCTKDKGDKVEVIGGNQTMNGGTKYDTGGMVTKTTFSKSKIVAVCFPTNANKKG